MSSGSAPSVFAPSDADRYTGDEVIQGIFLSFLLAQAPGPAPGVAPDWELKPSVDRIGPEIARLRPLFEQLQPEKWTAAGASRAY